MPFIKLRKLKMDSNGRILSGSAGLIDTQYVPGKACHSKQVQRENLGKVVWLSESRRSGLFYSPHRGLVEYSADTDSFKEVEKDDFRLPDDSYFPAPPVHTIFGDAFFITSYLKESAVLKALNGAFSDKKALQRVLVHIVHSIAKDGSHINCEDFTARSFLRYLFPDISPYSLKSDTPYFESLGRDETRLAFFRAFIKEMRKENRNFGRACYVDSTPLPNDITDNPFNALCCHGLNSSEIQIRLVMVLDDETDLPVWYDIIPGNVLDLNTILDVMEDVKVSLDIEVDSLVLDAGYASKEVIEAYHNGTEKGIIVRCPAKRGYHTQTIYRQVKDMIPKGKYEFVRNRHVYFGVRKEVTLFGQPVYYYVYVDKNTALQRHRDELMKKPEKFEQMSDKDKDWQAVKPGFFILISNYDLTPSELLDRYFDRVDVELSFRSSKEYLKLLPLGKWTDLTVRGKILSDVISLIVYCGMRSRTAPSGNSMTSLLGKASSLMCFTDQKGIAHIEAPSRQVKDLASLLKIKIPGTLKVSNFRKKLLTESR